MMYHKFINDREVFNAGLTLHTENGWVSNPTPEQIAADGWEVYVPPVVPPTPQEEPEMEDIIRAVKKMLSTGAEQLSDEDALNVAAVFPTWASRLGTDAEAGERLWDDGKLWKVLQPHTVQENWRPADAPSLFVEVSIAEWPDWRQPVGSTDAYAKGDKVTHAGQHWTSDVDGNVWEPGVYGWTAIA